MLYFIGFFIVVFIFIVILFKKKTIPFNTTVIEDITTHTFRIEGTSPSPITITCNDQVITTLAPNKAGFFQFSGKLPQSKSTNYLIANDIEKTVVTIHPLASLQEREQINQYATSLNEPLIYYYLDHNGKGGLIQIKLVQATTDLKLFPKNFLSYQSTIDHSLMIVIQYTNLSFDGAFELKADFFHGYIDAYFDDSPVPKIFEINGPAVIQGESATTVIIFNVNQNIKNITTFDIDFIPNDHYFTYFQVTVSH